MCELIDGYNKVCDTAGGIETIFLLSVVDDNGESNYEFIDIEDGEIVDMEMKPGKYAWPFVIEMETATFTDESIGDRPNGAAARNQSATVILHGNTPEMIVQIENLTKGRTALIAKLVDGTYEVLFLKNGAKVADSRTPGTAYEDMNGNTLTFTGKEPQKAPKISAAVILSLLDPVAFSEFTDEFNFEFN